jgi:hypothetical protein
MRGWGKTEKLHYVADAITGTRKEKKGFYE